MMREGQLPPPSAEQVASDDFVASIGGSTGHRALVISTPGGQQFYSFCAGCGERGDRWLHKPNAQQEADRHNEEKGNA